MGRPRKRPIERLEETKPGKIKVRSKTYGDHYRAPRGSVTEARLNETMQQINRVTLSTNAPAKLIHDALKPFRENFKGGLFYQRLQKHFNAQARLGEKFSITNLLSASPKLIEAMSRKRHAADSKNKWWLNQSNENINKYFPSSRMFGTFITDVNVDMPNLAMHLSVSYTIVPKFLTDHRNVDGLQLTFILLFPDFEDNHIQGESVVLPVRKITDTDTYSFIMTIPVSATSYMLFWKAESTASGIVQSGEASKSMVIERVGQLP